jgi:hypothetical protein
VSLRLRSVKEDHISILSQLSTMLLRLCLQISEYNSYKAALDASKLAEQTSNIETCEDDVDNDSRPKKNEPTRSLRNYSSRTVTLMLVRIHKCLSWRNGIIAMRNLKSRSYGKVTVEKMKSCTY